MVKEKFRPKRIFKNKKGYYFVVDGKKKYIKLGEEKIKDKKLVNINIKNKLGYVVRKKGYKRKTKKKPEPDIELNRPTAQAYNFGNLKELKKRRGKAPKKGKPTKINPTPHMPHMPHIPPEEIRQVNQPTAKGYTMSDLSNLIFSKQVVPQLTVEGYLKRKEDTKKSADEYTKIIEKLGEQVKQIIPLALKNYADISRERELLENNSRIEEYLSQYGDIEVEPKGFLENILPKRKEKPPLILEEIETENKVRDKPPTTLLGREVEERSGDRAERTVGSFREEKEDVPEELKYIQGVQIKNLTVKNLIEPLKKAKIDIKELVKGKGDLTVNDYKYLIDEYKKGGLFPVADLDEIKLDLDKLKSDKINKKITDKIKTMLNRKLGYGKYFKGGRYILESRFEKSTANPNKEEVEGTSGSFCGGAIGGDDGLWNTEIDEIFKDKLPEEYIPVISNDEMPSLCKYINKDTEKFGFIINTDNHDKQGSHWKAVFISRPEASVEIYDSLVSIPDEKFMKDLFKLVDCFRDNIMYKVKVNMVRDQSEKTENCGYFAVNFLINRFKGKKFKNASLYDKIDQSGEGENDIKKFKTFL